LDAGGATSNVAAVRVSQATVGIVQNTDSCGGSGRKRG
jgi:hypothetical protein